MLDRSHPLYWSFRVVHCAGTEFRISWWMPAGLLISIILLGVTLGCVFFGAVVLAILLHELGHVVAARSTGGQADELLLSPLGGLVPVQPGPGLLAQFLTAAAGPLVNLLLCMLFFPGLYAPDMLPRAWLPLLPIDRLHSETLWADLAVLFFSANWILLLINLLPVIPLDGGQMLQAALSSRMPPESVPRVMIPAGFVVAVLLMVVGLALPLPGLIVVGAYVLVVNVLQSVQEGRSPFADDSFMGYDFSQGYTSLERTPGTESEGKTSSWEQWKARRRAKQEQEARERRLQDEARLDELLAKVHEQGFQSLTLAEKRLLQRVSTDFRERTRRPST